MNGREVHVVLDYAKDQPDTWRLIAECADESTEMLFMGHEWGALMRPLEEKSALAASEMVKMLIADHTDQCGACQAWRKRS